MADVGKDVDVAISKALLSIESVDSLKPEQHQVLENFLCGRDVVGLLPTGFGKSLIYQLAPTVAKNLRSSALCPEHIKTAEFPSLIILSPLLALINDQVLEAREFGLSAMSLCDPSPTEEAQILSGKVRLMFANPETLVLDEKWRDMLLTERFQNNVVGLVVDEVHKTPSWGEAKKGGKAFRETFARIAELRSLCKHGTPVLALTASADTATRKDIVRLLNLSKHTVFVERSPNRTNIRLSAVRIKPSDDFACLDWLVTGVKKYGTKYILDNFPEIYSEQHAHSIMYIVNKVFNDNLDIDDLLEAIEADFESEIAQDPSIPDIPVTWSNSDSDNACAEEPILWDEFLYYDSD
uniref:Helicase ATP-binding domain-containing protein n=1 Tax=Branchiostoma floridae TaxID=7739 RepID=C3YY29_BRAFL|eukprot:XP_002598976.1 hypothetical protein BRAFLDRAFT_122457 [Branchiostoma floridae]